MKVLGTSKDNGTIVELTYDETNAMRRAQDAMKGQSWDYMSERLDDANMENLFCLVRHFTMARFIIGDFEQAVEHLKERLLVVEGGSDE